MLNEEERAVGRGDGQAVAENQEVEVPRSEQRWRHVHRRDQTPVANDRAREDEKEVRRQRRKKDRGQLFDELQDFIGEVDVARRRVDVDDERQQRDEEEEGRLAPASAEECEETDGEIEKADETEDQVGVIDLQLGNEIGEAKGLPAPGDD